MNDQQAKDIATEFYYWWHNQPGADTQSGFDEWWKINKERLVGSQKQLLPSDEKVYSIDGVNYYYHDDFINDLQQDYESGETVNVSIGDPIQATHHDFICIDQILEKMSESAYDDFGDISGSYLEDIDDKTKGELFTMIVESFDKCIGNPGFFRVVNVIDKQIEVE